MTLADTICKVSQNGIRTTKHVAAISILILHYFNVHFWYTNKNTN